MKLSKLFIIVMLIAEVWSKEKFKYKVVKPKKKCVITHESTFSVTGFLTFAVVSATAVANVIANINNNNDNNNNNNNQDNVNNNNQVSNSDDAENQGNARAFPHEKTNANAIANIYNNNDNNYKNQDNIYNNTSNVNNNNNQDNLNNNKQVSNSGDAENEGHVRATIYEEINKQFFCQIVGAEASKGDLESLMTSILGFTLADFLPNFKHEHVAEILENQDNYCMK